MNVISVLNQKGGCGKTITAVNLAAGLSKRDRSVLLIDLDPQGHASLSLGAEAKVSIADLLEKVSRGEALPQEARWNQVSPGLSLMPSSIGLASLEHTLSPHPDKLRILTTLIKTCAGAFDYVVIDCPPNLGILTINALVASSYALIPLMACEFSLKGMEILKNIMLMVREFQGANPTPFFLLNQVDCRSKFSREFADKVKTRFGRLLLSSHIRTNVYLREAASQGKNIFDYMPKSRGAEDFTQLAQEIEGLTSQRAWTSLLLKGKDLEEVYVVGDFNNWKKNDEYRLSRVSGDIWSINIPLEKGTYRYKFVSRGRWFADPHNKLTESDHFGGKNSIIVAE